MLSRLCRFRNSSGFIRRTALSRQSNEYANKITSGWRPQESMPRRFFSSPVLEERATSAEKSIEEQYSKKTPIEHVLLRPGMYVGPVERLPPNHCWVLDPTPAPTLSSETTGPASYRMVQKEYGLVPALVKIFDEILVNASDNRLRNPKTCTRIDVIIDPGSHDRDPFIQISNNGNGIPIQVCPMELSGFW
jgi:DNA gyrase/topoisomerase IV subunit B